MYTLHFAPDNASLIIRLVLDELGQTYRNALIDRSAHQQDSPAYRQINPGGLIPALVTPQGPIFETAAILLWLADRHGALAPAPGAATRGAFLSWLFFTANTLHPALRQLFYPEKYAGAAEAEAAFSAGARQRVAAHLAMLERMIQTDAPQWLSPQSPSVLGYYLACCLRWVQLYPKSGAGWFDRAQVPALMEICGQLQQRPAARKAARSEGLGPTIFTDPTYACPPTGSAA